MGNNTLSFKDQWSWLSNVKELFIPYLPANEIGFSPGFKIDDEKFILDMDPLPLVTTIDRLSWCQIDKQPYGLASSDRKLIERGIVPLHLPTAQLIERYFHSPMNLVGMNITRPAAAGQADCYTIQRAVMARLIGMLQAKEPWGKDGLWHAEQARLALTKDQVYVAFHHAASAREAKVPLDEYFFSEYECLSVFAMDTEMAQYLNWYKKQGGKHPRADLLQAASLIWGNQIEQAQPLLEKVSKHCELSAELTYERARASLIGGDPKTAISLFEDCLSFNENHFDAWLGLGIAIRTLHYRDGNESELNRAKRSYERVVEFHGYRESEAIHHIGTIHARFQRHSQAEECFRKVLLLRHSGVSRRNLILTLHAQGRKEEAAKEYQILLKLEPTQASNLEQIIFTGSSNNSQSVSIAKTAHGPTPLQIDQMNKAAVAAMQQLKTWGLPVQGDILDFKRVDEWFSHYAPTGRFSERSAFHGLKDGEVAGVILIIARHLAGVLVRRNHARWVLAQKEDESMTTIRMVDTTLFKDPLFLTGSVLTRYAVGAQSDNTTNLTFIVANLPEYSKLSATYKSIIDRQPATKSQLDLYKKEASNAVTICQQAGYNLSSDLGDLRILDKLIDESFEPSGMLRPNCSLSQHLKGETITFAIALGLHLGLLMQKFSHAVWYHSDESASMMVKSPYINDQYPITLIRNRIALVGKADCMSELVSFEPPLVCADLAHKFKMHEITTSAQITELLDRAIPAIRKEDPSGGALERMTLMIRAQAG